MRLALLFSIFKELLEKSFLILVGVARNIWKIHFQNRTLEFLGKISLEVILIEKVFMLLLEDICIHGDYRLYIVLTVLLTIIAATIINRIKLIVLEKK